MKGAEATLSKTSFLGLPAVEKFRVEKKYRNPKLDAAIRSSRTKKEARLLEKAKAAGVLCPVVYRAGDFSICMKYLEGSMLYHELRSREISRKEISEAAKIIVKLHSSGIVHGDYTPANLMLIDNEMAVIDFGLGSISNDDEDKATDIVMMKKALGAQGGKFVSAYARQKGSRAVIRMVAEIEKRARYMERG